jgi:hypothetical protein
MLPNDSPDLDQDAKAIIERGRKLLASPIQTSCAVQNAFQVEHYSRLKAILDEMGALDTTDPKMVVERAMSAFNEVEARAFVTRNVLENVKSGKSLTETLQSYHNLGLTNVNPARVPPPPKVQGRPRNGQLLIRILRKLGEVAFCLLELLLAALKQAPGFIGIKPSLGFVGGFPSITFQIEGESQSVRELFDALIGASQQAPLPAAA